MCCKYVNGWSVKLKFDDQLCMPKKNEIVGLSLVFEGFVVDIWFGGYKIIKSRQFNILYLTRTDFWGLADDSLADVVAININMNVVTNKYLTFGVHFAPCIR